MKKFLIAIFLLSISFGFSQKVKIKNDVVYVDNNEYVLLIKDQALKDNYYVKSLSGKDLFYLKINSFFNKTKDPKFDQNEYCYEIMSPDLKNVYFELLGYKEYKAFIKLIYNENVIKEGEISYEKLENLSSKIGFEFTKKRSELN